MTKILHLKWRFGLISFRKATLATTAYQTWESDLNTEKKAGFISKFRKFSILKSCKPKSY